MFKNVSKTVSFPKRIPCKDLMAYNWKVAYLNIQDGYETILIKVKDLQVEILKCYFLVITFRICSSANIKL